MKSKMDKILEKCNITEIIIDKDKKYVVGVEVSNLNGDVTAQTKYIEQVIDVFTKKLNMKDCIYIPMYNGCNPFIIREATEADIKYVKNISKSEII